MSTTVQHPAFPFHIVNGAPLSVEQDSVEEVAQAVSVLLLTSEGERQELPEYGVQDNAFQKLPPLEHYRRQVERWEPRAIVEQTQGWVNGLDSLVSVQVDTARSTSA